MATYPPAVLPQPKAHDLMELADAFAYLLASDDRTAGITWILGEVGMGSPQGIPFAYINIQAEAVRWTTANGGQGGLAAGLDDWVIPVVLMVVYQQATQDYLDPQAAAPPATSAFGALQPLPYMEQPGWREAMALWQPIKAVLRQNVTVGPFATTTNITESRPVPVSIDSKLYRALRITVQTQQRRPRGT